MLIVTSMSMKYPLCKDVFKLQHINALSQSYGP